MFRVVVGHSDDPDSENAIAEVLQECSRSLAGSLPQAGILFTAIDFDHVLILQRIQDAFPGIELIGGTANGEISSILEFQHLPLTSQHLVIADGTFGVDYPYPSKEYPICVSCL